MNLPTLPGPWVERALCAQTDPDLWHQDKPNPAANERAKRVCRACPVAAECLTFALDNDERFGIWGAMTADERHEVTKRKRERPQNVPAIEDRREFARQVASLKDRGWTYAQIAADFGTTEQAVKRRWERHVAYERTNA